MLFIKNCKAERDIGRVPARPSPRCCRGAGRKLRGFLAGSRVGSAGREVHLPSGSPGCAGRGLSLPGRGHHSHRPAGDWDLGFWEGPHHSLDEERGSRCPDYKPWGSRGPPALLPAVWTLAGARRGCLSERPGAGSPMGLLVTAPHTCCQSNVTPSGGDSGACCGFPQAGPRAPSPFAESALCPFAVISHSHEPGCVLSPGSAPGWSKGPRHTAAFHLWGSRLTPFLDWGLCLPTASR